MKKLALVLALLCPFLVCAQELEAGTFVVRKISDETADLPTSTRNDTAFSPTRRNRRAKQNSPEEVENRLKLGLYISDHSFRDSVERRFRKTELKKHREFIWVGQEGEAIYFSSSLSTKKVKRIVRKKKFRTGMVKGKWQYSYDKENNRIEFEVADGKFNGTLVFTGIYKRKKFKSECYSEQGGMPDVDDQNYTWVSTKRRAR